MRRTTGYTRWDHKRNEELLNLKFNGLCIKTQFIYNKKNENDKRSYENNVWLACFSNNLFQIYSFQDGFIILRKKKKKHVGL
ncbi:hypothetical protein C0J52_10141 [Blattella germanica]|nr:hypothetical protein C0J52_10141 [Blattella germanica]